MTDLIYTQTLSVSQAQRAYPEVLERIEEQVRYVFRVEAGVDPATVEWRELPEFEMEIDGKTVTIPPYLMVVAEGQPSPLTVCPECGKHVSRSSGHPFWVDRETKQRHHDPCSTEEP